MIELLLNRKKWEVLPARVRSLVKEWTELYQIELQENWNLAREHEQLKRIPALE